MGTRSLCTHLPPVQMLFQTHRHCVKNTETSKPNEAILGCVWFSDTPTNLKFLQARHQGSGPFTMQGRTQEGPHQGPPRDPSCPAPLGRSAGHRRPSLMESGHVCRCLDPLPGRRVQRRRGTETSLFTRHMHSVDDKLRLQKRCFKLFIRAKRTPRSSATPGLQQGAPQHQPEAGRSVAFESKERGCPGWLSRLSS